MTLSALLSSRPYNETQPILASRNFLSDEISFNQFFMHVLINFSNNHVCERVLPGCDQLQSRREQAEGDKRRLKFPHQGVRHQEGKVHIILAD